MICDNSSISRLGINFLSPEASDTILCTDTGPSNNNFMLSISTDLTRYVESTDVER